MRGRSLLVASALLAIAATPLPPRTDRLIYDTANVIDDGAERALEQRQRELFERAGVAIVIVTVPKLVDETIGDFATRVGQTWGVGRAGQDRGLVIALSRDDRAIFVATGYGTEGYLPDGRVGSLIDSTAIPALRQNRFSDGIVGLSNALVDASAKEYGVELQGIAPMPAVQRRGGGLGGLALLVLGLIAIAFLAKRHPVLAMMLLSRSVLGGGGFGSGHGRGGFGGGFGGGGFGGGGAGRNF